MTFIKFLNQIKIVPKCIDCKYYLMIDVNSKNRYAESRCLKNVVKCSLTGLHKPEYAYIARSENSMCGPKGTNFYKKDV